MKCFLLFMAFGFVVAAASPGDVGRQCRTCTMDFLRGRVIMYLFENRGLITYEDSEISIRHDFNWPDCNDTLEYSEYTTAKCVHMEMSGGDVPNGTVVHYYGSLDTIHAIKSSFTNWTSDEEHIYSIHTGENGTTYKIYLCEKAFCFVGPSNSSDLMDAAATASTIPTSAPASTESESSVGKLSKTRIAVYIVGTAVILAILAWAYKKHRKQQMEENQHGDTQQMVRIAPSESSLAEP